MKPIQPVVEVPSPAVNPEAIAERTTASMWVGSIVMFLATLIAYVDRQALAVLAPTILADVHMTATDLAFTLSAFSIAYMFANFAWGSILDKIGLPLGMAIAVAIWTTASTAHAIAGGLIGFAAARIVLGIGEGAVFPGCVKMARDCLPTAKASRGIAIGYSGAAFGSLLMPLAVGPFAAAYGWRTAFWITGALGVLWLLLWSQYVRNIPKRQRASQKVVVVNPFDRRFWLIVTTYGMGAIALGVIAYLSALYLNRALGLSQSEINHVVWIPTVGWQLGYYFWGWVSDRIVPNQIRPLKLLFLLSLLALPSAFVTMVHSWQAVLALFLWAMFVADGFIVMGLHIGARVFTKDEAGLAGGIGGGSWSMVLAAVLPFYGKLIDAKDYTPIFVTMSLFPLAGTLLYMWLSKPWANKSKLA
ncbi:MAG: MFS transporter [Acidobacteriota bacterium]